MLIRIFASVLSMLEPPASPEPPSAEVPPIQRPRAQEPPPAVQPEPPPPTPVEPPPVTPAPVEPPPPIEPPTQPANAPAPQVESPFALPPADEPLVAEAHEPMRPISPAFRRPGVWVAVGSSSFAIATVMHFMVPYVASCSHGCNLGAVMGLYVGAVPIDALSLVAWGFAGRSYGLRDARRTDLAQRSRRRRASFIGSGVACIVAGFVMTSATLLVREPTPSTYEMAAVRQGGIMFTATGAFLVGYGAALPRNKYAASAARRRFAIVPTFGRSHAGLSLTWRR